MSICIFPGTFNPIHEGHLKMAQIVLAQYGFEKIIFIPSYIPPHKNIEDSLAKHRYNMVKLATANNPKFEVSDIEYKLEGKSYSVNTVKRVIEQYDISGRLNFIIGTDAFSKLDSWYRSDELKMLVHFLVFPRRGDDAEVIYGQAMESGWDFEVVKSDYIDISSTEIREHKTVNNNEVEEYIKENGLYKD